MVYIIIGVCVVLILIMILVGTIMKSKFYIASIKIDKAEQDIDIYLVRKKDLLDRTRPIVTKELKLESFLTDLDQDFDTINNFLENDILRRNYNELLKTIDENDKLLKSKALKEILQDLEDNDEDIIGAIKFYNDTVVDYNKLVGTFPGAIVAFVKRYKKKEFYNNEKRETFEILS